MTRLNQIGALLRRLFCNTVCILLSVFVCLLQERRKDLTDHREDSTFSFDPSKINIKTLTKDKQKRIDARKGVLLSSYTRKKTRRRKRGRSSAGQEKNGGARSRFLYLYLRPTLPRTPFVTNIVAFAKRVSGSHERNRAFSLL